MHDQLSSDRELGVWDCYESAEDLQRSVRMWPLSRFLLLVRSPGTEAFGISAADKLEGRVDLLLHGSMENERALISHSVYSSELERNEKDDLIRTTQAFYPRAIPGMLSVAAIVADVLNVPMPDPSPTIERR